MDWIDPHKKLPEGIGFTRCLVVSDRLSPNVVHEAMYNNKTNIFQNLDYETIEIKYWMPLPEAPKE